MAFRIYERANIHPASDLDDTMSRAAEQLAEAEVTGDTPGWVRFATESGLSSINQDVTSAQLQDLRENHGRVARPEAEN